MMFSFFLSCYLDIYGLFIYVKLSVNIRAVSVSQNRHFSKMTDQIIIIQAFKQT